MASVQEKIDLMKKKKEQIMQGGGAARIAKQHEKGKMTARERIAALVAVLQTDEFNAYLEENFGEDVLAAF